ncbi:MAG: PspC domain-containing protein [Moraxella sp.]|nr:PspC domain-containing protein [Moraxella sp.]
MAKLQKLHRSQNHRMLAGVLGGIAEYIGWTPTAVRILFWLVIILSAGVTLPVAALAYGLMWILMPEATPQSYIEYNTSAVQKSANRHKT